MAVSTITYNEPVVLLGAALILLGNWINIRAAMRH
jgi:hypothetical protein